MKIIEIGNYGEDLTHIHPLKYGRDAFGDIVNPEDNYKILPLNTILKSGDKAFDIYVGWIDLKNYYNKDNRIAFATTKGRWICFERKIERI